VTSDTVIDGTAEEISREVIVAAPAPTTLFRTDDPVEVVERASRVADALKGVLDRQGLTALIGNKRHVLVEGWTTLGAMVGVTAVPVWTKPLDGNAPEGRTFGWEARVEAHTLDGRVIGAAEAMCTRAESRWKSADDYALRSMAQTRATSKALRGPLGFVVTLAGYQATPAEEMPADAPAPAGNGRQVSAEKPKATEKVATAKQRGLINGKAAEKKMGSLELGNVLLAAAGQKLKNAEDFDDPEDAQKFVNRNLDRLPARLVDPVLKLIEQHEAEDVAF